MRRARSISILTSALLVSATACAVKSGNAPAPSAPEPAAEPGPTGGDPTPQPQACTQEMGSDAPATLEGAPTLAPGTLRGCYGMEDNGEVFVVNVPAHDGPVLYRMTMSAERGQPCLSAKDESSASVKGLSLCSPGGATITGWIVAQGGSTWSLWLRDIAGDAGRHRTGWTIQLDESPIDDAGEPDSKDKPVPLALGEPYAKGYFVAAINAKDADRDYYVIEIPKNMPRKTRLQIAVSDVGPNVRLVARVFDDKKRDIGGASAANEGANLEAEAKLKGPGKYVIELSNLAGAGTPVTGQGEPPGHVTRPYTIMATVE